MTQVIRTLLIVFMVSAFASSANANEIGAANSGLEQAGLKVEWSTQLDVAVDGTVIDHQIVVDENDSTTYFEIVYGTQREVISQKGMNPFGEPFGIEGADKYARIRAEVIKAQLVAMGKDIEPEIKSYTLPRTTIFTLTNTGLVSAVNADTGAVHWSTHVGTYKHPTIGLGANEKYVAVCNGTHVYCLDAKSGKIIFSRETEGIATTSPAVGGADPTRDMGKEGYIYVPLQPGTVEVFSIENGGYLDHFERGIGAATARPLITDESISWPTNRGHYNVMFRYSRDGGLSYRVKAFEPILGPAKFYNGSLYVTSLDGFVYAVNEKSGVLRWDFSTGEEISQPAIPINDSVYVITDEKDLYRLDALTGINSPGWDTPLQNIDRLVGSSKSRLYVTDTLGRLVTLDLKSQRALATTDIGQISFIFPNYKTDRLYVGYGNGQIQCLREIGSERPFYHSKEVVATDVENQQDDKGDQKKPMLSDEDDPFKAFDSDDMKSDNNNDPFGGKSGSDPFGGNSGSDPFGGNSGSDPFGGNSQGAGGKKAEDKKTGDGGGVVDDPFKL